jgi:hypothetical protein
MIPIVFTLIDAKSHYINGYSGQMRCIHNGKETTISSFEEAIQFYKEEQTNE